MSVDCSVMFWYAAVMNYNIHKPDLSTSLEEVRTAQTTIPRPGLHAKDPSPNAILCIRRLPLILSGTPLHNLFLPLGFSNSFAVLVLWEDDRCLAAGLVSDLLVYSAFGRFRGVFLGILVDFHAWHDVSCKPSTIAWLKRAKHTLCQLVF